MPNHASATASAAAAVQPRRLAIVVIATGVYFLLGLRLVKGMLHFHKGADELVFYFHSDADPAPFLPVGFPLRHVPAKHQAWPAVAKSKYACILAAEPTMRRDRIDHVCYIDADTVFDRPFGDDWFPSADVVAGEHYCNRLADWSAATFETRPESVACISAADGPRVYFYGCFWGGRIDTLLELCRDCLQLTHADEARGINAVWDDESYLNKVLHDHRQPDVVMLCDRVPFRVSDKGGWEHVSRTTQFNLDEHRHALLRGMDGPIRLVNCAVLLEGETAPQPEPPADPIVEPAALAQPVCNPQSAHSALLQLLGAGFSVEAMLPLIGAGPGQADIQALLQLALQHDVAAPAVHRLLQFDDTTLGAQNREGFEIFLEGEQLRSAGQARQLEDWLKRLALAGIPAMPIKGPRLASDLHGVQGLRACRDLDILFRKGDIDRVLKDLQSNGFELDAALDARQRRMLFGYGGEFILFHPEASPVEPHWEVAPSTLAFNLDYERLWRSSRAGTFQGAICRLPPPEWDLLLLCLHGAKEKWHKLKWVADITDFVAATAGLDWRALHSLAAAQGCARMLNLGLLLAHRLLGMPLPAESARLLAKDAEAGRLADEVMERLAAGLPHEAGPYHLHGFYWRMRERLADRWRYALRTLFTVRVNDYRLLPMPIAPDLAYLPLKWLWSGAVIPIRQALAARAR